MTSKMACFIARGNKENDQPLTHRKSDGLLNPTCTCAQGGDYVLCLQHVDISEALQ